LDFLGAAERAIMRLQPLFLEEPGNQNDRIFNPDLLLAV